MQLPHLGQIHAIMLCGVILGPRGGTVPAMAILGGPAAYRARAAYFKKWATMCASPATRDRLISIAQTWNAFAMQMETRGVPNCCGDLHKSDGDPETA